MRTFAAIDVGSYEVAMKIFEISEKKGLKQIDHLRHRIELGTDTYHTGKIDPARMDELCDVLSEFGKVMRAYRVDAYRAYGTSAIRETENTMIVIEQIKLRTGIRVEVLSNSEQRFMHYKAVASRGETFARMMRRSCAIVDIGGGSIQISLFDKDALVTTQNIRLGVLRVKDMLSSLRVKTVNYTSLLGELIDNQLESFRSLYLGEREISNIIVVDDYISAAMRGISSESDVISYKEFRELLVNYKNRSVEHITSELGIDEESAVLLPQSIVLLNKIADMMQAKTLWVPGVSLSDGIAYEFAEDNKLLSVKHDFEADIIAGAEVMCRRYGGNVERNRLVEKVALSIFDDTKKLHGMGKRERLLIRIASMLSDCGKYISLEAAAECGYEIIMATEMIGVSHSEREIIANVVRFNKVAFEYYKDTTSAAMLDKRTYLAVAKLTAIFRVADGICRSYRIKLDGIKTTIKDDELIITIDSDEDFTLEKGFFNRKSEFFEEVFSLRPVIRNKRRLKAL
ncbi:MAG: exopolyphosphatase [Lachnospiraceae bacterium]|nr:exopolyphosphatase [Lachnospiraceae bacterium]MBR5766777.1 exopolyphosphatase [Lachnospiraceae bacterium]